MRSLLIICALLCISCAEKWDGRDRVVLQNEGVFVLKPFTAYDIYFKVMDTVYVFEKVDLDLNYTHGKYRWLMPDWGTTYQLSPEVQITSSAKVVHWYTANARKDSLREGFDVEG